MGAHAPQPVRKLEEGEVDQLLSDAAAAAQPTPAEGDATAPSKWTRWSPLERNKIMVCNERADDVLVFLAPTKRIAEVVEAAAKLSAGPNGGSAMANLELLRTEGRVQWRKVRAGGAPEMFTLGAADRAYVTVALASDIGMLFTKDCVLKSRQMYVVQSTDIPQKDAVLHDAAPKPQTEGPPRGARASEDM